MKNRSKRLRKKLHVGEFTQYGLDVSISYNTLYEDDIDEEIDFIMDRIYDSVDGTDIEFGCGVFCKNKIDIVMACKKPLPKYESESRLMAAYCNWLFAMSEQEPTELNREIIDLWN